LKNEFFNSLLGFHRGGGLLLPKFRVPAGQAGFRDSMMGQDKRLVVCTHGRHGSSMLAGTGSLVHLPAIESYPLVDSNDAGDNFLAGFILAHTLGMTPERCQKYATIAASPERQESGNNEERLPETDGGSTKPLAAWGAGDGKPCSSCQENPWWRSRDAHGARPDMGLVPRTARLAYAWKLGET
jgi:hypothetical protein